MMKSQGCMLLTFLLLAAVEEGMTANPCTVITDHAHSKTVHEEVQMVCEVSDQAADSVIWTNPSAEVVSTNCQGANSKYSVKCTPFNKPTKYTLTFNATWADRGQFTCKCSTSGIAMSTKLTVKVPPSTLKGSCTVKDTGGVCNVTSRKGSDILQFEASVGCAYPSTTISWTDDVGAEISTSKYNGVIRNVSCTGATSGQTSATNTFEATWSDLGKPTKVTVAAANEVGGMYLDIPIHKPPEKEDITGVVIGAILGVILFLIILGLIIFLVIRAKKKKQRMAYV